MSEYIFPDRVIARISLAINELAHQRPKTLRAHYIELRELSFTWFVDMLCEEPQRDEDGNADTSLPWIDKESWFFETYKRSELVGVSLVRVTDPDRWKISMGVSGQGEVKFYFKTKTAADEVHYKLLNYLLNNNKP